MVDVVVKGILNLSIILNTTARDSNRANFYWLNSGFETQTAALCRSLI